VARFFDREGLRPLLAAAVPDGRTSPNQIPVVDIVLALFAAVLTGGRRFAHVERLRADRFVQTVLGLSRTHSSIGYLAPIEYERRHAARDGEPESGGPAPAEREKDGPGKEARILRTGGSRKRSTVHELR